MPPSLPIRPSASPRRLTAWLALVLLALLAPATAAAQDGITSQVFRRFADRVIKVQVVEGGSAAKAGMGTGFFTTADGHVVTNYHVISQAIHAPDRYRVELVDSTGATHATRLLALDVVHDLAVLGTELRPRGWFDLSQRTIAQGNRLYSLGHPRDLGLSIVEGTYNGHLRHTLYPKIHFTGSLNPGMSGGPTIADDGRVVGVNVSTAGNQLSFLVPVERASALLALALRADHRPAESWLTEVGRQLREYQDAYLANMFDGDVRTVQLGRYSVPTEPAPFFRCWADADRSPELTYEKVMHSCSTDDYVFVADRQSSGVVELYHEVVSTRTLNSARFFSLYGELFQQTSSHGGMEEHVTSWRCGTRNVRNAALPMRAVLCLRRYQKLGELYDAELRVAALGRGNTGLVSTLTLSGVSFENVELLSRRYLERIAWR